MGPVEAADEPHHAPAGERDLYALSTVEGRLKKPICSQE
jgi:hypothetical protein